MVADMLQQSINQMTKWNDIFQTPKRRMRGVSGLPVQLRELASHITLA